MVKIDVLFHGFPGKASNTFLGWSTIVLLRREKRLCLVDTGGHGARLWLLQALKDRGLHPNDVDSVFLTHLHFDHIANVSLFPRAMFYLGQVEWEYANTVEDPVVQEGVLPLLRAFKKTLLKKDGEEVLPGVSFLLTPGHTPGSASLLVDEGIKTAISGDAIKNRVELATGNVGMTQAAEVSRKSVEKVKALAARVLPGHDCALRLEGGRVVPEGDNTITITLPDGITIGGGNVVDLRLDR
ncbi:MAG: MBL fold metallo-hydrolase [Synergistaceae bacterium]|jgi:glyoxylase-like metal-dependent hydrolase (beta-lactamase superfamily II)|nr:MBL fold metallo-hydrolase [Synergistaceae bacterium]